MSQASSGGLSIPGYRPVEKLGAAPSFGVWVRAVQTRMDRQVLLKLLPPGAPAALQEYFAREIDAMVRCDGHGVLRVIDEGRAGELRYLVLDEAGAEPLPPDATLDASQWRQLADLLLGFHRRAEALGCALLPIPREAFARLPSGEIVALDLGWFVPDGAELPRHPALPPSAPEKAAPWLNAPLLAAALRQAARGWGTPPAAVERGCATLAATVGPPRRARAGGADATQAAPDRDRQGAQGTSVLTADPFQTRSRRSLLRIAGSSVLAIALVAGAATLALRILGPGGPPPEPDPQTETAGDHGTDSSELEGGAPARSRTAEAGQSDAADRARARAAEGEAAEALCEILGVSAEGGSEDLTRRATGPLDERDLRRLRALAREREGTRAAQVASSLLRAAALEARLARAAHWRPQREAFERSLADGELASAEAALRHARLAVADSAELPFDSLDGWDSWAVLADAHAPSEVPGESRSTALRAVERLHSTVRGRLDRVEREAGGVPREDLDTSEEHFRACQQRLEARARERRQALAPQLEALRSAREYDAARRLIADARPRLTEIHQAWLTELEVEYHREGKRFLQAREGLAARWRAAAERARGGAWDDAIAALEERRPGPEFSDLVTQWERWRGRLVRAKECAELLGRALEHRRAAREIADYPRASGGEPVRGRVVEVSSSGIRVKHEGRRRVDEIAFVELPIGVLQAVCFEELSASRDAEDWALFFYFLGAPEQALAAAAELDPPPEWLADARREYEALQGRRLDADLRTLRDLAMRGQWQELREGVRRCVRRFSKRELGGHLSADLRPALERAYQAEGPRGAFPGAHSFGWDPGSLRATVHYVFDSDEAVADWTGVSGGGLDRVERYRDALKVQGNAFLSPGGETTFFRGELALEARIEAANPDAPNLNAVLWARPGSGGARGLVGGLGFKPRGVVRMEGKGKTVLLPGNVIGPLGPAEAGEVDGISVAVHEPKVPPRRKLVLRFRDDGRGSVLERGPGRAFGRPDKVEAAWRGASYGRGGTDRTGTVAFRSYSSVVFVHEVRVTGTLDSGWWRKWRDAAIARDLRP